MPPKPSYVPSETYYDGLQPATMTSGHHLLYKALILCYTYIQSITYTPISIIRRIRISILRRIMS